MVCGGFLTVEFMRRGMKPTDACVETLKRAVAMTTPRLLDQQGRPKYGLTFYAINKNGDLGAASLTPAQYAAWDGEKAALHDCAVLYPA
jgi:N4-(beta-N-acetylglucosaminyl)-L-asparaginase